MNSLTFWNRIRKRINFCRSIVRFSLDVYMVLYGIWTISSLNCTQMKRGLFLATRHFYNHLKEASMDTSIGHLFPWLIHYVFIDAFAKLELMIRLVHDGKDASKRLIRLRCFMPTSIWYTASNRLKLRELDCICSKIVRPSVNRWNALKTSKKPTDEV